MNARKPRRLRRPPPDTATIRFVPLDEAAPGQPPTLAEQRATRAVHAMLRLGGYDELVAEAEAKRNGGAPCPR